jgi:hypothetical protein
VNSGAIFNAFECLVIDANCVGNNCGVNLLITAFESLVIDPNCQLMPLELIHFSTI